MQAVNQEMFLPGIPWLAEFFSHLVTHKHGPEDSFEFRLFIDLLNLFTVLTCFPEINSPCVSASRVSSFSSSWSARRRQSSAWRAGCGAGGCAPPPTPPPRGSTPPTPTRPGGGVTLLSGCPVTRSTLFYFTEPLWYRGTGTAPGRLCPRIFCLRKRLWKCVWCMPTRWRIKTLNVTVIPILV